MAFGNSQISAASVDLDAVHVRRFTRRSLLLTVAALGATMLSGPRRAQAAPLLQSFGRPVAPVSRVLAAGPPAAVMIACLAPEKLIGWPMRLSEAALALLPMAVRDRPMIGRLSGRGSTMNLEAVLAHKPDVIVDAGSVDDYYVSSAQRVAEQTGLYYVLVDGRLADAGRQIREVGLLLGVQDRAQALAAYAEQALARASAPAGTTSKVPTVYLARGADGLETATTGSINAEFIEAAGGSNAAATGRGGVARVSMEQVLGWAPDWIVTQDRNFFQHAQSNAAWRAAPAVREGRLLLAPSLPFGWLDGPPSINRLLGVEWLAAQLHRTGGTARESTQRTVERARQFHGLFYGVTPSAAQVQDWLEGRG